MNDKERNLELAKECGCLVSHLPGQCSIKRFSCDSLELNAYTARICAEKDAEIDAISQQLEATRKHALKLDDELSEANAKIAMQAEALKYAETFYGSEDFDFKKLRVAIKASSSTVAKWEAESAAKVLEDFIKTLRALPSIGLSERQFGELERATKVKE